VLKCINVQSGCVEVFSVDVLKCISVWCGCVEVYICMQGGSGKWSRRKCEVDPEMTNRR